MELKDRLKELRKENKLKQTDIAKIMQISSTGYASWEQGLSEPNITMIKAIADYYNIPTDYLIGRTNNNYKEIIENENEKDEKELLQVYRKLPTKFKIKLLGYALGLKEQQA